MRKCVEFLSLILLLMLCSCAEDMPEVDNAQRGFVAVSGESVYYLDKGEVYTRDSLGKNAGTGIKDVIYIAEDNGRLYYLTGKRDNEKNGMEISVCLHEYNPSDRSDVALAEFPCRAIDRFYITDNRMYYTSLGKLCMMELSDYAVKEIVQGADAFCVKGNMVYYYKTSEDSIKSFDDVLNMKKQVYAYDTVSDSHTLLFEPLDETDEFISMGEGFVAKGKELKYIGDNSSQSDEGAENEQYRPPLSVNETGVMLADSENNIYYHDMEEKCIYRQNVYTGKKKVICRNADSFGGIAGNEIYVGEWRKIN